jgi:hypothetical protein
MMRKKEAKREKIRAKIKLAPISLDFSTLSLDTANNRELLSKTPKLKNDLPRVI